MNIKTANRLCELRKKNGLSQEDLADKLGVSRQAVSKWERSESSPDTDNLIELARLYGISLDELINGDDDVESIIKENKEADKMEQEKIKYDEVEFTEEEGISIKGSRVHIQDDEGQGVSIGKDGVTISDEHGVRHYSKDEMKEKRKHNKVTDAISAVYLFVAVISFLLLGYFKVLGHGYGVWWIVFLGLPIIASLSDAIIKRKASHFAYPVFATLVFFVVGFFFDIWSPTWVVFVTIPLYYIIVSPFEKHNKESEKEE